MKSTLIKSSIKISTIWSAILKCVTDGFINFVNFIDPLHKLFGRSMNVSSFPFEIILSTSYSYSVLGLNSLHTEVHS